MYSRTKPLISIAILCLAFAISYVASAQTLPTESTSTNPIVSTTSVQSNETTTTRKEELQRRFDEARNQQNGIRAELTVRIQERILNLSANMSNRMDATTVRMNQIISRLNSRIEKQRESGMNVETALTELARAEAFLLNAQTLLLDIDTTVITAIGSDKPRVAIKELNKTYLEIATNLRATHDALRSTVSALKSAPTATFETNSSSTVSDSI